MSRRPSRVRSLRLLIDSSNPQLVSTGTLVQKSTPPKSPRLIESQERFDSMDDGKEVAALDPGESSWTEQSNSTKRPRFGDLDQSSPERRRRRRIINSEGESSNPRGDTERDSEVRGGMRRLSKSSPKTSISAQERLATPHGVYGNDDLDAPQVNGPRFSQHDLSLEPIWFLHLVALFNCDLVPHILFARASKPSTEWNNYGKLVYVDLSCLNLLCPALYDMVEDEPSIWLRGVTSSLKCKERLAELIDSEDETVKDFKGFSQGSYLSILAILISALPEPWGETTWEGIEEELWEVVESTFLPLLGILEIDDIEHFLSRNMIHQKGHYLFALIKRLIHFTIKLGEKTPQNIFSLISHGINLLERQWSKFISSSETEYLHVLRCIAKALNSGAQPYKTAARLMSLDHRGSRRSNAAIGFALASLPPSWRPEWRPISPGAPSAIEILAQAELFGAISLSNMPVIKWEALPLDTKVLVAFSEAKKKAFANAAEILSHQVNGIEEVYGSSSIEALLTATVLINCWNSIGREVDGERLGQQICSKIFPNTGIGEVVRSRPEAYLSVAIADSFLGQSKFQKATGVLVGVMEYPTLDANLAMCVTLRLLKISRRLRDQVPLSNDWSRLKSAVEKFDKLSDTLKYECIEETICSLSVLEPEDILRLPQVSGVVRILSGYDTALYRGSPASRVNLLQNLEELQRFKTKLNLFSLSGPPLYFCRKMRERFSSATVPFVERVASANWQRSKRIKEMRDTALDVEFETCPPAGAKSRFDDSGLGSSIGSSSTPGDHPLERQSKARSTTSINSFMSLEEKATPLPLMPLEDFNGERACYICEKTVKSINNESQWRRHVFGDLRPYVCIVENCDTDCMKFATRSDFANHLREHQQTKILQCSLCGYENGDKHLVEAHIASTHTAPPDTDLTDVIGERLILRDLSKQNCPFCDDIPGTVAFVGHICHHLEEISLSAIPRDGESQDDDASSSNDSSLESLSRKIDDVTTLEEMADEGTGSDALSIDSAKMNITPPLDDAFNGGQDTSQKTTSETGGRIAPSLSDPSSPTSLHHWVGVTTIVPVVDEEETYTVKCICGFDSDDANTIYCEICDTWQHIECYYPGKVKEASAEDFEHFCIDCKPRAMMHEKAREQAIARGLTNRVTPAPPERGTIAPDISPKAGLENNNSSMGEKLLDTKLNAMQPASEAPVSASVPSQLNRPRGRPRKHPMPVSETPAKIAKGRNKTGCITCRKRMKRCDETKPKCLNCEKNSVVCEGYSERIILKNGKKMAEDAQFHLESEVPAFSVDTAVNVYANSDQFATRVETTLASTPKSVAFELLIPESPQYRARLPMRVQIFPHDTTESITTTIKNFYGLYSSASARGVSFEDDKGNPVIARYENLQNNMIVYVRVT